MKKLVLLDAHAIIHRAYHALPDFQTKSGEPTGGLYGFANMILGIANELKPDYMAACYDLPEPTFRHHSYEDYKGTRTEIDENLITQLDSSREICRAFSIPIYEYPGFEADDILGTIARIATEKVKDLQVIIASGDMDTLQLVSERVSVYTLKKGVKDTILYNPEKVEERFGFAPTLIPDYKGLRGDPSDNIPGVSGIGEKTATELIKKFGTLEELYKKLEKKGGEEVLAAGFRERIVGLLQEGAENAEMSKTLATIRSDAPINFTLPKKSWKEGIDTVLAREIFTKFEFKNMLGRATKILGIELIEQDISLFQNKGVVSPAEEKYYAIMAWILNSDLVNLGQADIIREMEAKSWNDATDILKKNLKREKSLQCVFEEIEVPLIPILEKMSKRGIKIDKKYFKELGKKYHQYASGLEREIHHLAGDKFNVRSPKQLSEILFGTLGLPTKGIKKNQSGGYSTNSEMLEKLDGEHEIIEKILKYREIHKLISTYVDVIPGFADAEGVIHPHFIQNGTTTGRFSSDNPNMQNIPIRSEFGQAVRAGFVARDGYTFLSADYSQIELKMLAILSGDPTLIKIFQEDQDVHMAVAGYIFDVDDKNVTSEMRRIAKTVNFGIVYGMGITSLAKSIGRSRQEAEKFYNSFFNRFAKIDEYLDGVKQDARKNGYTETLFGRRRYISGINSDIPFIRAAAERMAINAPIQGSATADMIKLSMIHIDQELHEQGLDEYVFPTLQIHDEILFEVKIDVVEQASKIIREQMSGVMAQSFLKYDSPVPITVDVKVGNRWGDWDK